MMDVYMFDMGGVLSEENSMAPALLQELGLGGTNLRQIGPKSAVAIEDCLRGVVTEEDFWNVVNKERGTHFPVHGLLAKHFKPVIDQGVLEVINQLRASGKRVICGTNVIAPHFQIHQERGDYAYFDKVYPSFVMKLSKPDPEFYRYIIGKEGVPADRFFFVDDTPKNVESALAVGMHAFVFTDAASLKRRLSQGE